MDKKSGLLQKRRVIFLVIAVLGLTTLFIAFDWPLSTMNDTRAMDQSASNTAKPRVTETLPAVQNTVIFATPSTTPTQSDIQANAVSSDQGVNDVPIILSMSDGNYYHLFAYHPQLLPLTRLTQGNWNDINPAISPDGKQIAFSSNRNGYWDIYILDLEKGENIHLTDTPEYDASPTWSPDGRWIAYESYQGDRMAIYIISVLDPSQPAILLTDFEGSSYEPAWSPCGREIAFVSNHSGEDEVWVASLDDQENRFINLSKLPLNRDRHPAWSSDCSQIAWASQTNGSSEILLQSLSDTSKPKVIGLGDMPVYSPENKALLTEVRSPNMTAMAGYEIDTKILIYPAYQLPGSLNGFDWKPGLTFESLSYSFGLSAEVYDPPALVNTIITSEPTTEDGRYSLVPIQNITAPFAFLHDAVDEAFFSLKARVEQEAGWNFLDYLEGAYLPLTEAPPPNMPQDWLYTGRGIAVNSIPISAGWMVIVQENYMGQTYWRVYLKARYQDGSQGQPLTQSPWDLNSRYSGDPQIYERGGEEATIPKGYWVDFTEIARRYGWMRIPALNNWRSYVLGTNFNMYIHNDGLDWYSAMRELYPAESLATATINPTITRTPTITRRIYASLTPIETPTLTLTPTLHPTWTPGG
jgi:TolB protein